MTKPGIIGLFSFEIPAKPDASVLLDLPTIYTKRREYHEVWLVFSFHHFIFSIKRLDIIKQFLSVHEFFISSWPVLVSLADFSKIHFPWLIQTYRQLIGLNEWSYSAHLKMKRQLPLLTTF